MNFGEFLMGVGALVLFGGLAYVFVQYRKGKKSKATTTGGSGAGSRSDETSRQKH